MAELDTLIPDIYKLFDPEVNHEANEDNLNHMADAIKDAVRGGLQRYEKRQGTLRFSGIGKQPRQLWYDHHIDPAKAEKMTPETYFKFLYGHILEALVLFCAKEAGHEVSDEQGEVDCEGVKGHLDAVIDGHVIDVKSASPYGFKKFQDGELQPQDDSFGYIRQLAGYASVKVLPAAFLAVDKVGGKLALSPLSGYAIAGHPPAPRIKFLKEVLDKPEPPERCYSPEPDGKSGNMKLGTGCSYCKWKDTCWSDANNGQGLRLFLYSNGPRWLTHVAKTPDVYEVTAGGNERA